jgi:hypothetical protein
MARSKNRDWIIRPLFNASLLVSFIAVAIAVGAMAYVSWCRDWSNPLVAGLITPLLTLPMSISGAWLIFGAFEGIMKYLQPFETSKEDAGAAKRLTKNLKSGKRQ